MTQRLNKMNTNQLRDIAVSLGADRKRLYGTSRQVMILKIHELQKTNQEIKELKAKREELVRMNRKEYTTRGNTARCQELFRQITEIDEEIARREK